MMKATMIGGLMLSALVLTGCQQPVHSRHSTGNAVKVNPVLNCGHGQVQTQTTLWFGLNRPAGGTVSAAEWQSYVDQQVTPRFQAGLSVYEAKGQWMGNNGILAKESSKALMLIHANDAASDQRIEQLRSYYKTHFGQDSVMRIDQPVCVDF